MKKVQLSDAVACLAVVLVVATASMAAQGRAGGQGAAARPAVTEGPGKPNPPAVSTLTLLGTAGGPGGHPSRAGIASLLTVNGTHYLIDAGQAVVYQMARAGVQGQVPHVFLTHLHNDHTGGLFALVTFRGANLTVYGPPRTDEFVATLVAANQFNLEIRNAENEQGTSGGGQANAGRAGGAAAGGRGGGAPARQAIGKVVQPGVVYSDANVTVEAIENSHFNITSTPANRNKSYAYKVRTPDRVFVFTGDTGWSEALVKFAAGADILVAEMVSPTELGPNPNFHMTDEHLSPTQVGRLATAAKVKTVIASHVRPSLADDLAEIRRNFNGVAVIGEDFMKF